MKSTQQDLAKITLSVIFIGALLLASFWVVQPFLAPSIWATMIVIATWPLLLRMQAWLGNRRTLAVMAMTLTLLLLFMVPLVLAIVTIVKNADQIVVWTKMIENFQPPTIPSWIAHLPFFGDQVVAEWQRLVNTSGKDLLNNLAPHAGEFTRWVAAQFGSMGKLFVQFLLTLIVAAVLYANGESAAAATRHFGRRLGGPSGEATVQLASQAIRSVALGVGVTAVVQAVLGGLGLFVVGIPFAGLLTAFMFLLCIAQLGPLLVLIPAVAWIYWSGDSGWGTFLLIWSLVISTLDGFLRPILIRQGANLPLMLIMAGVIGGLLAFGLIGIFIGPVVLGVAYTLLGNWVSDENENSV